MSIQIETRAALSDAADVTLDCLGVRSGDRVLVLCNEQQRRLAEALAAAARARTLEVRLLQYPALSRESEEPPRRIAEALLGASVVLATTTFSISHTRARIEASSRGARIAGIYVSEADFVRTIDVDYGFLARSGGEIAAALTAADTCRIASAAGTDVALSVAGRSAICDDGNLREPGAFGNLPAGEAYIAPIETVGDGTIVFDGALAGYGVLKAPLRVDLRDGRAVSAEGEAADWLLSTLDAGGEHGRSIAEVGIGTNPSAEVCGEISVDEKVLGTAHIAFGTSIACGGANEAGVHIDGILLEPTVELDGVPLTVRQSTRRSCL
jgi:leucyl aminopeptidase (aminopeptidase T)